MTSRDARSLASLQIVVTRAANQASSLVEAFEACGASAVPIAMIEIVEASDGGSSLAAALASLGEYDQIVVSSPNGARVLRNARTGGEMPTRSLPPVACVGPSTAAVLIDSVFEVNVVPDRSVAEGLLAAMPTPQPGTNRLLLLQAEVARMVLAAGLAQQGWDVDRVVAYKTIDAEVSDEQRQAAGAADIVAFTSSSTVERFVRLVGTQSLPPTVASIGPITSATARELGLTVDIEADPHTIEGLVDAVVAWVNS